jgi:hypothetical protein
MAKLPLRVDSASSKPFRAAVDRRGALDLWRRWDEFHRGAGPGCAAVTRPAGRRMAGNGGRARRIAKTGSWQPAQTRRPADFRYGHVAVVTDHGRDGQQQLRNCI